MSNVQGFFLVLGGICGDDGSRDENEMTLF